MIKTSWDLSQNHRQFHICDAGVKDLPTIDREKTLRLNMKLE